MSRQVTTEKGSVVKRSTHYGVGKYIGSTIYVHRQYESVVSSINAAKKILFDHYPNFTYNVVAYDTSRLKYTFIQAGDFDTADEPEVGNYRVVYVDTTDYVIKGKSTYIYHHKWLFVKDDYKGFDVKKSFEHSKKWTALPNINYNKIGNKTYWNKVLERLE